MSKPSSPATPDYVGAANATANSQRVNYQTPWGSINWFAPGQQGVPNMHPNGGMTNGGAELGSPGNPGPNMHSQGFFGNVLSDVKGDIHNPLSGQAFAHQMDPGGSALRDIKDPKAPSSDMASQSGYGSSDPWTQVLNLSPEQQQLYDRQTQTSLGLADLQNQGLQGVQGVFNHMPSASDLPAAAVNPGQTGQDAIMQRLQPLLDRQHGQLNQQLANQGIQIGSEAYQNAQGDFGRQANDAQSQAALHGIDLSNQARQQAMNEQGFYSQMPINLLNALRSGSQVQVPTGPTTGPGANYSAAAQAANQSALGKYGADTSTYNSQVGAGSAALAAALAAFSDRRLKSNIVQIGMHGIGIPKYEYDILGRREQGVMADELERVMPEAVVTGDDGYKRVHYWMIGGR